MMMHPTMMRTSIPGTNPIGGLRGSLAACLAAAALLAARPAACDELSAALEPLIARHRGRVAVAVKHLERGAEFAHQADTVMPTASLIKFPVMVAAYRLADAGQLDLNRMLTLRDEDKVPGSGILTGHFTAGTRITVRDAIRLMIAFSDNTATNLVLDQIGLKTTADVMEQLGLADTKIHAKVFRGDTSIFPDRSKQFGLGSTTPRQMIQLLELLHQRKAASPGSCDQMLEHLLACEDKNKLLRELPPGTKVAHKTGSVNAVRTDAGILMTPGGPIAVCVMTAENDDQRWTNENAAEVLCGRIGRTVYDHFQPTGVARVPEGSAKMAAGASGPLVEALQRTLNTRLKPSPELSVDGAYGPLTRAAVQRFQQEQQLPATGEVGFETWRALGPLLTDPVPAPSPDAVNAETLPRDPREDLGAPPLVTGKAWAIADARTGVLLWGYQERQRLHFASTTKMMTAYVVLSLAERDPAVLDQEVTFSQRADDTGGSSAALRAGERLPVRDLLYGLMLPSGNDASVALGEHFGAQLAADPAHSGDPLDSFVDHMNRTAQLLGMHDTRYRNTHGLTHAEHLSTAADLIVLARASLQLPRFREYVNTRQHGTTVTSAAGYSRNVVWKNTNKLLAIDGYSGVKTGTTDAAGACLVSCGERDGDELLVVVLGSATSDGRYIDTRNLFRWAWSQRAR
jgi:D-alanyl-D-alanine carboxypeptidase (penicillin-binding protein 5/6)